MMKPNIIFLLNSPYPNYTGGRETWINNVCNRLTENYNITIIAQEQELGSSSMGTFTNIDSRIRILHASTLSTKRFFCKFVHSYVRFFNKFLLAWQMKKIAEKIVKKNEDYIVISMDTVFMAYTGRKLCEKFSNIYHVASSRGPHAEIYSKDYPALSSLIMEMEKKNLNLAHEIWANGYDTYDSLKKKGFESIIIRNGVDIAKADATEAVDIKGKYKIDIEEKILVTIGTLEDIKGYRQIILALSKLKKDYGKKIHFFGVGKGSPDCYLKLAEENGVANQVHFVGENRNTVGFAKAADVVACLSGGAGLGMACLESMVSKKPIVAWNSSVYTQMLKNRESGILVKEWDENDLADGINYILEHYSEGLAWAEKAYADVKKYDWKNVVEDIEKAFDNLGD